MWHVVRAGSGQATEASSGYATTGAYEAALSFLQV